MKVELSEYGECFSIDLSAEDMKEAALLTRMGMNSKKEITMIDTYINQDGTFKFNLVLPKSKKANNYIPKRG
jgi:hypothetical protein